MSAPRKPVAGMDAEPTAHVGDRVFFRTRAGKHCAGEVTACGRDGFTAKSSAGIHKVSWKRYVGHKQRRERTVRVLDEGEDGALGKLDDGTVIFLRQSAENTMQKAMLPLLFKGGPGIGDDRECWPSGYLKPRAGDRVFQMLRGFVRPVIVNGVVYETGAGRLRVRITSISGPAETETGIGQTLPLTEQWRCYGDHKVQADMTGQRDPDRVQRNLDQVAAFGDATRQAIARARALEGHRPIDCASLQVGDRIYGWDGGAAVAYTVASIGDYGVSLYEEGASARYVGSGKRRYRLCDLSFSIWSPGDRQDAMERFTQPPAEVGKSLIFFKAGPLKNRPGLTQEERQDKTGKTVKRWVRTGGDQPGSGGSAGAAAAGAGGGEGGGPPRDRSGSRPGHEGDVGEHITFDAGGRKPGHGKVVAKGKDGLTVETVGGNRVQVTWEQAKAGHVHDPARGGVSKLNDEQISKLHEHVEPAESGADAQPKHVTDETSAYVNGSEGLQQFRDAISRKGGVADALGAQVFDSDAQGMHEYLDANPGKSAIILAPLKGRKRAAEKASKDGWKNVRDLVRGTVVVPSIDHVPDAIAAVKAAGLSVVRFKNRFHAAALGYRDILMNVRLPNGHVAELQIHAAPMLQAKDKFGGHDHYDVWRALEEAHGRGESLDDDQKARHAHAESHMEDLYDSTWRGMRGMQ